MQSKLVSIIVPIYNVEKYVKRCVDSIINQTYKNIEIICVDDGTVDNSIQMISSINDSRLKIVHKDNGGLSSARNYGLKYATGDFISFVDSDDWVDPDFIMTLIKQFYEYSVDIACIGFDYAYNDHYEKYEYKIKSRVLSCKRALTVLCEGKKITNHVWNKMYKAQLFENVLFKEGRRFEDIYIMHCLFMKSKAVSVISKDLYHYFMRSDSILHEEKPQNIADIAIGYISRYNALKSVIDKYFTLKKCAWASYQILFLIDLKNKIDPKDYDRIAEFWKHHKQIGLLGRKYLLMYLTPIYYRKKINRDNKNE